MSDLENLVHNAFAEMQYPKASAELAELRKANDVLIMDENDRPVHLWQLVKENAQLRKDLKDRTSLFLQEQDQSTQLRTELDVACHVKANDKVDFDFAVLEEITICRGVILTLRTDLDEAIRVIEELTHPLDYDIQFAHAATFLERVKHGGDA